jgi:anti-sigma28 factor (negative regulator of flagellin synthesis)
MIKLEVEFKSGDGGFSANPLHYVQLDRTDKVAVYQRCNNGKILDHEVFRIKILPKGTQIFKTITEDDQEKYPGASQFGLNAWSTKDKDRAMQIYKELCHESMNKVIDQPEEPSVKVELVASSKEFTTKQFAEENKIDYQDAVAWIKEAIANGSVKFLRTQQMSNRGKPSKIFCKIA